MFQDLDAVASGEGDVVTLKRAITNGDVETVTQLLDKGVYRYSLYFMLIKHIPFCWVYPMFWSEGWTLD